VDGRVGGVRDGGMGLNDPVVDGGRHGVLSV
jgi:hypothetical protein